MIPGDHQWRPRRACVVVYGEIEVSHAPEDIIEAPYSSSWITLRRRSVGDMSHSKLLFVNGPFGGSIRP